MHKCICRGRGAEDWRKGRGAEDWRKKCVSETRLVNEGKVTMKKAVVKVNTAVEDNKRRSNIAAGCEGSISHLEEGRLH